GGLARVGLAAPELGVTTAGLGLSLGLIGAGRGAGAGGTTSIWPVAPRRSSGGGPPPRGRSRAPPAAMSARERNQAASTARLQVMQARAPPVESAAADAHRNNPWRLRGSPRRGNWRPWQRQRIDG